MTMPLERTPGGWDATAETYDRIVAPFTGRYAADALDLVGMEPGERVLDVAAGSGALTLQAARRGAQVLATDFSSAMVERLRATAAREGLTGVDAAVMDGQALTVPEGTFDVGFSIFGLIFFPDRAAGFRGLHRALRPGGRVAVAAWSTPERVGQMAVVMESLRAVAPEFATGAPSPVVSLADRDTFRSEMEAAGFHRVGIHTVTHEFTVSTPEDFWGDATRATPGFIAMSQALGPERLAAMRAHSLERLHARFGDGPVRLPAEAHIAIGTR